MAEHGLANLPTFFIFLNCKSCLVVPVGRVNVSVFLLLLVVVQLYFSFNPFGGQLGTTKVAPCLRNEFLSVQHDSGPKMFVSLKASSLYTQQKFTLHDSFIIHF
jgi:hypothetical protein